MQLALRANNGWVVDELLELGADPETLETPERNPGPAPCELPDPKFLATVTAATLQECIDWGADVNAPDDEGLAPLHHLVRAERPNPAARALIVTLAGAGADVDARNDDGATPLYLAASAGRLGLATALLEAGADVNAATGSGRTPLHGAAVVRQDPIELVSLLVGAGAIVDARDERGRTALHEAPCVP